MIKDLDLVQSRINLLARNWSVLKDKKTFKGFPLYDHPHANAAYMHLIKANEYMETMLKEASAN